MKKTNGPKLILTLFSIAIGIIIASMMKSGIEHYAPVTVESIQSLKSEISMINNEIIEMNQIIKEKEEELEILKNIYKNEEDIVDILSIDLVNNKFNSGYSRLVGPGISIKMYDNQSSEIIGFDVNDDIIHDVDILNILNDLRVAGAEAISINGERVISSSEIKCAGPTIRINGTSVATPFVIKAIGDPKQLMAAVNAPGTYGETLREVYAIGFEPSIEDKIIIPSYSGRFSFKYAKPKGEGEI
ncbi:DUF881 domain-containing protein [Wansuia hejianensis]|uniref:DUF881 domain-containing protein n=1 Tax=Wansuia hejianensis TaxID=2763667 RepID=A0A926F2B1_9FIRM|nr:DUF881 domain-containing protein [Wansuia hejianensis]MBC8590707.1 DUF881 domain-containing protein [Wansuia hejianensis]